MTALLFKTYVFFTKLHLDFASVQIGFLLSILASSLEIIFASACSLQVAVDVEVSAY